jgi:carboxylesterase type B
VFLWIYGGGFLDGDSPLYNGSAIVAQSVARGTPVIYVSINYRTGPLGFPQGVEAAANGALNLGLRDQIAALKWVQANIAFFGGDRKQVTVFGESAGAISIAIHQLRPDFSSLARGVILESGSGATTVSNYAGYREKAFADFVASLPSCAPFAGKPGALDCLRSQNNLTSAQLIQAITTGISKGVEKYPYVPVLGDDIYPALPSVVLKTGNYSKIPFIAGTNLDEGTGFAGNPATITNETAQQSLLFSYSPSLVGNLGPDALVDATNKILDLYPDNPALGSPFNTGNETFGFDKGFKRVAAILGDLSFQSQRRLLQQETAAGGVASYGYLFTDPQPAIPAYLGVTHAQEIPYVFGACQTKSAAAQMLCLRMIDYWVSFAVSQTPNDGKGVSKPTWQKYTTTNQVILELNGANTSMIPDTYRKSQIDFINQNSVLFHHRRSL